MPAPVTTVARQHAPHLARMGVRVVVHRVLVPVTRSVIPDAPASVLDPAPVLVLGGILRGASTAQALALMRAVRRAVVLA